MEIGAIYFCLKYQLPVRNSNVNYKFNENPKNLMKNSTFAILYFIILNPDPKRSEERERERSKLSRIAVEAKPVRGADGNDPEPIRARSLSFSLSRYMVQVQVAEKARVK